MYGNIEDLKYPVLTVKEAVQLSPKPYEFVLITHNETNGINKTYGRVREVNSWGSERDWNIALELEDGDTKRIPYRYIRAVDVIPNDQVTSFIRRLKEEKTKEFAPYIEVFKAHFGDNGCVDVHGRHIRFFIRYKNVTVENDEGNSREVNELVFQIRFRLSNKELYDIKAKRFAASHEELMSDYTHSHVSGGLFNWTTSICLGDTDINHTRQKLNVQFSTELFELFLMQLDEFVTWESLSGGPYIRMDQVMPVRHRGMPVDKVDIDSAVAGICLNEYKGLSIDAMTRKTYYLGSESVEDALEEANAEYSMIAEKHIGSLSDNGDFYSNTSTSRSVERRVSDFLNSTPLKVEGIYNSMELEQRIVDTVDEKGDKINPLLITRVKEVLKRKIDEFILKRELYGSDFFKTQTEADNQRQVNADNLVSTQ
jgi:hypothetical protein